MQLTAADVEAAFIETARTQENGEPFNWHRLTLLLNQRVVALRYQRAAAFILGDPPTEARPPDDAQ